MPAGLARRYGPLPLYAWAGLAIVGFLVYRHLGARIGSGLGDLTRAPASPEATPITAGDASGGSAGGGGLEGGSGMGTPADPTTIVGDAATIDTSGGAVTDFTPSRPVDQGYGAPSAQAAPVSYYSTPAEVGTPPSSVYVNPVTGTVSTVPQAPVTPGGGIPGRGVQGGL
jgi:hypothetical protein